MIDVLAIEPAAVSFLGVEKIGLVPAISLALMVGVGVLATPSFRQRIYSGASVESVRRSFVIFGLLYLGFCVLPAVIGMAAHALNPELDNSNFAFPYLATQVLPAGLGLVVLIAGLSAPASR